MGDQKNAMQSLVFGAWRDDTKESAADRAFQAKLQEQLDSQSADKKNAGMKFAMKMAGGKDDVAKRMTFQAWADEVKASAFEREKDREKEAFMSRAKEKKQQMERMVANMVGRNDKQLRTQVLDAWRTELERSAKEKKAMWLLDQQSAFERREANRGLAASTFQTLAQAAREATHIKTLQKMEDAIEEERILPNSAATNTRRGRSRLSTTPCTRWPNARGI